jgi:hypothetical protein
LGGEGLRGSMGSISSKGWDEKVQKVQWVQKVGILVGVENIQPE